ncbi:MAG: DUF4276 family protein [Nannocystis sp.]|nr:DUF4276 family protein [Nannocystis sp.]MBA3547756.1 DUF4276 family protein [Nannocystis sp.]
MIYLRAALFAEGSSDYDFLLRLLNRLIEWIAAALYPGDYEVAETIGIDAPRPLQKGKRADRIAAACIEYEGLFELLVIHADGDTDPHAARTERIEPGIAALHAVTREQPIVAVPCIPVREIEAWMLADAGAFQERLGSKVAPALPGDPEREGDPKAALQQILKDGGARRLPASIYAFFGERVALKTLRSLPAFQTFEAELTAAIREVASSQGHYQGPTRK